MRDDEFKAFLAEVFLSWDQALARTELWLQAAEERTDEMVRRTDEMTHE